MELSWRGESIALPRSRKCRALLGYLAVSARAHRREQLCALFWDVADDPRGALRWTLSRLRAVLPAENDPIEADRESVLFRTESVRVDAVELGAFRGAALAELSTEELERAAAQYRGEFLEGLELPDFLEFTAWCVAQREELRRVHCAVVSALVERWQDDAARALPWARRWVQIDAFDIQAHQTLLRLLLAEGFSEEAERRYSHVARQFREVAAPEADALARAWTALRVQARAGKSQRDNAHAAPPLAPARGVDGAPTPFVGRQRAVEQVRDTLEAVRGSNTPRAVLVSGEPGAGKSRLLERLRSVALEAGFEVLAARAFDLERGRPFGPWIDALGVAPGDLTEAAASGGRERLFDEIEARTRRASEGKSGVVLVLDDVQWLDRDSAEALHHLLESYTDGPLLALLAARGGEVQDNPAVVSLVGNLQRRRTLLELELEPLTRDEVIALVGHVPDAELERLLQASSGNPLYVLELARGALDGHSGAPPSLVQLVRERVSRLSDGAHDVLRWAAVLGFTFDSARLDSLSELSQGELVDALEELERHALLRIDAAREQERYAFGHDIVREAVYGELSHPRKRLMHRKVAHLLQSRATDPTTAYEVARHASLAGEGQLGVRACITAGQYALRTCANADAEALARRGLHHAADLDEAARVEATLELLHVLYSARAPDRAEASERVRALAERALDLGLTRAARIGFQMLSYLRWESSSMAAAHENILQAERVSRSADPDERSQALAQAARCLVLLERNLGQAEAFAIEASGVATREGRSSAAVAFALAMIAAHRGERDVADAAFREAQDLARANGERLAEFGAIEHRVMLAIDGGRSDDAIALAESLVDLGSRVRPGAEVSIARALQALARVCGGKADAQELSTAAAALRAADAKYELSFVLTRWAAHALSEDALDEATQIAADALEVSRAIGRISETVIAAATLGEIARRHGDVEAVRQHLQSIAHAVESDLSAQARSRLQAVRQATTAQ